MAWTKEQSLAIAKDGTNIIVSAGAGSGKTAVLTERVLQKIKNGVHINELLIMTFTNAAAKEMKDRIRKKLKNEGFQEEINLIDSSYITTFDSFSLSIVKKYHYIINLPKEITIADSSLIEIEKEVLLDQIFDEYYLKDSEKFQKLIKDFCYKDDDLLKKQILKIDRKLELKIDKQEYLNNYLDKYFSKEKIEEDCNLYENEIKSLISSLEKELEKLSLYLDSDYIEKCRKCLKPLLESNTYDEVVSHLDFNLPNFPRNTELEANSIKKNMTSILSEVKDLCIYENTFMMQQEIFDTYDNVSMIIEILLKFNERLEKIKYEKKLFSFSDISRMAIKIVGENNDIKEELKYSFSEIMLDEYQDTNDVQEYFVSLISNNNVYMVGDMKQSIYRFRNANPYIFKTKYDLYSKGENGIKIDLLKNFRSRKEVLDNINLVFDYLMDDDFGGVRYRESHQMIFGNNTYIEEGKTDQNYDLKVLEYEEDSKFSKSEQEAFIIGNDIKEKIARKVKIFDKDEKKLRDIFYQDFVILLDRATDFDLYKKIFEYLSIPLTLYKDEEITTDYDILIIRNILKLELAIHNESMDQEFKYAFMSVGRSFLFDYSDQELFDYFYNNSFKKSNLYKKCEYLYEYYLETSLKGFFIKLLEIFNYEENLLKTNNIEVARTRLEYFYSLLENLENSGNTIEDFINYLDIILKQEEKPRFSLNNNSSNSVRIMTIHKSKGLEFPICYFAGFSKSFSYQELNDAISYSDDYGIIVPYISEYKKDTIYKTLLKKKTKKEEVSEKIRLLYVALTRAKEKMIMVIPKIKEEDLCVCDKLKIKSFLDMIKMIYESLNEYKEEVSSSCTKDYLKQIKNSDLKVEGRSSLEIKEFDFSYEEEQEERFSKNKVKLISKEEKEKLDLGTKLHELLEFIDFKNPDYSSLSSFEEIKIKQFIESDLIKNNINSKFYKEYEFIIEEDGNVRHGIIDLMIESSDKIIIVDYKLKNVDDEAYQKQLKGYQEIISNKTDKKIELYLYSILDGVFIQIK